jgi:Rhodopirellula transposase DDE domain
VEPPPAISRGAVARPSDDIIAEMWAELLNRGHDGIDHETSKFAVNLIGAWWKHLGRERYPNAKTLTVTRSSTRLTSIATTFAAIGTTPKTFSN